MTISICSTAARRSSAASCTAGSVECAYPAIASPVACVASSPAPVAVGSRGESAQRGVPVVMDRQPGQLDQRIPSPAVVGQLLGQRPHRVLGRTLLISTDVALPGTATDDVGQPREGLQVIGVLMQGLPEQGLLVRVDHQGIQARTWHRLVDPGMSRQPASAP